MQRNLKKRLLSGIIAAVTAFTMNLAPVYTAVQAASAEGVYTDSYTTAEESGENNIADDSGVVDVTVQKPADMQTAEVSRNAAASASQITLAISSSYTGKEYDGTPMAVPTENQMTIVNASYSNVQFTWADSQDNLLTAAPSSVGTYTLYANILKDGIGTTASTTVTITQGRPNIGTVALVGTAYAGSNASSLTLRASMAGSFTISSQILLEGTNTITYTFTPSNPNYYAVSGTLEVIAVVAPLTSLTYTGYPAVTNYTYGDTFSSSGLTFMANYADGSQKNVTNVVTFSELDAGDTSVTVSYTEDSVTMTLTITDITVDKKIIDVSGISWIDETFVFDGTVKTQRLNETTIPQGVSYVLSGNSEIDAGGYTAVAALTLSASYRANYRLSSERITKDWIISKASAITGLTTEVNLLRALPHTGETVDIAALMPDDCGDCTFTLSNSSYTYLYNVRISDDGILSFDTVAADSATSERITVSVTSENYKNTTVRVTVNLSEKLPITITGITKSDGTYNGRSHKGYTGTPSGYDGTLDIVYKQGTKVLDGAPVNAGDYTVTFTVPDSEPYYIGSTTLSFSIKPAELTITADSHSIRVDNPMPTLTYTVKGLYGDDELVAEPVVTCETRTTSSVGVFAITALGAVASENYTITKYIDGTLTINDKTTIDFSSIKASDGIYNAEPQRGYIGAVAYAGELSVTYKQGETVLDGAPTDVGTYTVVISVPKDDPEFKGSKAVSFMIEKADVTIIPDSFAIKVGWAIPTLTYQVSGLKGEDELINEPTLSCDATSTAKAGIFAIKASGASASSNYNVKYKQGLLTINDKNGVDFSKIKVQNGVYNGEPHKGYTGAVVYAGEVSVTYKQGEKILDGAPVNAGEYSVTFDVPVADTDYAGTFTIEFTIEKAEVVITPTSFSIREGWELPELTYKVTGLVGEETLIKEPVVTCAVKNSNIVGEYPITASGASASSNYRITYEEGILAIGDKIQVDFSKVEALNGVYNGEPHKGYSGKPAFDGEINVIYKKGEKVLQSAPTNAGDYTVTFEVPDDDPVYKGIKVIEFTIEKAELTITPDSFSIKENWDIPEFTYKVKGLVGDEQLVKEPTLVCEATDSSTVGQYPIIASGAKATANYTITYNEGVLAVGDKIIVNFNKIEGVNGVYNGETHQGYAGDFGYEGEVLVVYKQGDRLLSGAPKNAGVYTVTLKIPESTPDYKGSKTIEFTIEKAAITITADDHLIEVNDAMPKFTYTVTGLVGKEKLVTEPTATCEAANTKRVGEYAITLSNAVASANYTIEYVGATLTIIKKNAIDFSGLKAQDGVYNGKQHLGYTGKYQYKGEMTITYMQGEETLEGPPVDVGEYTVIIQIPESNNEYKGGITFDFKVTKAPLVIKAEDKDVMRNEELPELTYTVSGLVEGEELIREPELSCNADAAVLGDYEIKIWGAKASTNYEIEYIQGVMRVYKYTQDTSGGSSGGSGAGGTGGGGAGGVEEPEPSSGTTVGWININKKIDLIPANGHITIDTNGATVIPEEVMENLEDNNSYATFVIDEKTSWTIDGTKLQNHPRAADLTISEADIPLTATSDLRGIENRAFMLNGTNAPAVLNLTIAEGYAGKFANVYRMSGLTGNLEFVDNALISKQGLAERLAVGDEGSYIVMISEYSDRMGDVTNDGVTNALDASYILQSIVGMKKIVNKQVSDFNADSVVNAMDSAAILRFVVGL